MINICHNCDCMDFMGDCKDNQFNLAIIDPPYGLKKWTSTGGNSLTTNEVNKISKWDKAPDEYYFQQLGRISKYQIIWGANHFFDFLGKTKSLIVWDKKNRGMHFSDGEMAWVNCGSKALRIFEYSVNNKGKRIHPTQKPVALYKWLLKNYAQPGWTIFDSHVGSGSIRIACYDMGFDFVGCELDKDYWQAQEERFQNHISNKELIDPGEMQSLIYRQENLLNEE